MTRLTMLVLFLAFAPNPFGRSAESPPPVAESADCSDVCGSSADCSKSVDGDCSE